MKIKKGDRLRYVGPYEPEVVAAGNQYPPGEVIAFRYRGTEDEKVTVRLDGSTNADPHYADWPVGEVEKV